MPCDADETVEGLRPAGDRTVSLTVTDKDGGVGQDSLTLSVAYLAVEILIAPEQTRNPIRLRQGGRLPLAVFSSAEFDATGIDPASVTLGNEDGGDTPVAQRPNGSYFATHEDVDGDGSSTSSCTTKCRRWSPTAT